LNDFVLSHNTRYRVREEIRRLRDARSSGIPGRSRSHWHLHEINSTQEDQLHSAVNQAIHGLIHQCSISLADLWTLCCSLVLNLLVVVVVVVVVAAAAAGTVVVLAIF